MEPIELEPRYTLHEVPGKCVRCLAEEKLYKCMRELLMSEDGTGELTEEYMLLHDFLESPDLQNLCDETERYLSDGKEVSVKITMEDGTPKYKITVS